MTSGHFLDLIKKAYGLDTDYQLMQFLGWPKQTRISNYRGGMLFDNDACRQVAEKLHMDPMHVIACMEDERAKEKGEKDRRAAWRAIAEATKGKTVKMAATATAALFLSAAVLAGFPGEARASSGGAGSDGLNSLYIMLYYGDIWNGPTTRYGPFSSVPHTFYGL
jgi:hypothetical protein